MSDGIYVALSGAIAQAATLDATAQNLANASTDGYQRMRPVFREALSRAAQNGGPLRSVTASTTSLDTTRGAVRVTSRALDVALPDKTYLAVATGTGERYTRAGSLNIGSDGTLKTQHGDPLVGDNGRPIRANREGAEVKISPSGEAWQGDTMLGRLRLVSFPSPDQLAPEGATLLNATPAAGAPTVAKGELSIGSLEESNTSVVGAMTDLVTASRTFDAFQRAIDAFRDADQKIVTTVPGDQ
jgi:flagellar basal-body rod protein FlgF